MREWLSNAGAALAVCLVVVFWGLLDGYDIWDMILISLMLGTLVGFFFLALWLFGKVPALVVPLVYASGLAALGSMLWLATGETGVVTFVLTPAGVLGLVFLAAAIWGGT